ncbi:MAG: phosphoribosylformylglycinamidine synthase subunit PurS [Gemmatimonas sp.]|jgi:phosphoribosylformylglycinamidine synthase PurS subunit|uniref:phosphoribosylformylglycinamidine synthase subunit PurS n=1 Tax=Gemmatimonas sp. TaxID=1962908 RepID=UPI0025C1E454|nr:phosphoribosylformylglycinamidine synthase subunit PurS [Gemmatimonas sp.]MCA2994139.1 phosphoribosylformylglycinamidine synthase subunit PurS [Gemmatimonas sp.]MCE2952332.1 phosphoribosylformylglycinamidine synthase subunit PurS [Gemmatimonas sp.]
MTRFRCAVHIVPRRGILDPQGKAVSDALHSLAFTNVSDVRVGRYVVVDTTAESETDARAAVKAMCEKLLANPVTEDYDIASVERA